MRKLIFQKIIRGYKKIVREIKITFALRRSHYHYKNIRFERWENLNCFTKFKQVYVSPSLYNKKTVLTHVLTDKFT